MNQPSISEFSVIPTEKLEQLCLGLCPCCGEPFSESMRPDLTARCHKGPVFVSYWDGWVLLSCGTCKKPIGRIQAQPSNNN